MGKLVIHPLFGFDISSKSANVSSQIRTNLYVEVRYEKDKTSMALIRTAGLGSFASVGASPPRGLYDTGTLIYLVSGNTLYDVNNAGVSTVRGTLNTSSGRVDMIDNGTQILIVDGTNGYIYTIATLTLAQIVSGNFPNGATTCTFQAGFFLVDDPSVNGRFRKSASYDGTTWAALDFATAESNPDPLGRVFVNQSVVHLLGGGTTEFWSNTGALDFPYSPVQGTAIEWGLGAKWSVAKLGGLVTYLATNTEGQLQVIRLNGYQPTVISSPEMDNEINNYSVNTDATAFSYKFNGHEFYQINFGTVGKSWLYDLTTSQQAGVPVWSKVTSGISGARHLGEMCITYLNQNIVADYSTGNLYKFQTGTFTDNSVTTLWKLTSKHVYKDNAMLSMGRVWVDFETGVGLATGQGSDPRVMLRYSKDGGHSWSAEVWRSIGAIGRYLTRVYWNRLGRARDWVFEISGSDAVKIVIMNAGLNIKVGRE